MKTLGKLQINPERFLKNEELLLLRGGYDVDQNCQLRNCSIDSCSQTPGRCTKCEKHPNQSYWICVEP